MSPSYPAKILLFGEHTVLRGGRGLAVPYHQLSLRWQQDRPDEGLLKFCDYLRVVMPPELVDTEALEDFLLDDWRLVGDIPVGYGLGSSGAVCAAVWERFATPAGRALTGEALRKVLARMEQHFHGTSSGTDPLICYLNQPVELGAGTPPQVISLPAGWNEGFFLVDTGQPRQAAALIRQFTDRYDADPHFARQVYHGWTVSANAAIAALLTGDRHELWVQTNQLAAFQRKEFANFIPPDFQERWSAPGYTLKLCGAGGGGMMLGLATDRQSVLAAFDRVCWL